MEGKKFDRFSDEMHKTLYENLNAQQEALSQYACKDKFAVRRNKEAFLVARPNFVKDVERILNCRYFNRYADKTQVFSLYKNDDITRRIMHVQIVSRIARNIGRMLNLNQDLIEAVALGHDLGHTPFGHAGERYLSALFHERTGKYFRHNVHSVRILDKILKLNLSLQTLDGILCHNGEQVRGEYKPYRYEGSPEERFAAFEQKVDCCYGDKEAIGHLVPGTLEGCCVRISDILAYLGKDRQDATILGMDVEESFMRNEFLGATNSEFISNTISNLVENSYGKGYLKLDEEYSAALDKEKKANYKIIYESQDTSEPYPQIRAMFRDTYEKLYDDIINMREDSPIFRHHIKKMFRGLRNAERMEQDYIQEEPNQIVVDYIASMTDDYFLDIHEYLFPEAVKLEYTSYFRKV